MILIPLHLKQHLAHGEGKVAAELITQSIQYQITASLERKRKSASVQVGLLIPNLKNNYFTSPCLQQATYQTQTPALPVLAVLNVHILTAFADGRRYCHSGQATAPCQTRGIQCPLPPGQWEFQF